jgi:hypothetical protein
VRQTQEVKEVSEQAQQRPEGEAMSVKRAFLATFTTLLMGVGASSASAATPAPGFTLDSLAVPSNFSANDNPHCVAGSGQGNCDAYQVTVTNVGSQPTDGNPLTLTDTPPPGVTVQQVALYWHGPGANALGLHYPTDISAAVGCTTAPVQCPFPLAMQPDDTLEMFVYVTVNDPSESAPLTNQASVSIADNSIPEAATSSQNTLGASAPKFGFANFGFYIAGVNGARDTQAGDHPYELNTRIDLNSEFRIPPEETSNGIAPTTVEDPKDIVVDLPLGFVGSTLAAPRCTLAQLSITGQPGYSGGCPQATVVGYIKTVEPGEHADGIDGPLYNVVPERGHPAEFGFQDTNHGTHVLYASVVPTPGGYVLRTTSPDITQINMHNILVTFYGNPTEKDGVGDNVPFFTNPSDCAGEEPTATIYMDSWQHPARFNPDGTPVNLREPQWAKMESKAPAVTGCNALQFPAQIEAQPTTHESDKPSGVNFNITLPQSETMGVPATPTLKKVVETFPPGFTVDPSAGGGLQACSEAQIGWLGPNGPNGEPLPNHGALNFSPAPPECPEASKIGVLELETPLIGERKLTGEIFLARQYENPNQESGHPEGSLIGLYVVVHDPITGVLIKITGKATLNPNDGQITGEFDENPNLPFSNLELHFFGGPRAEFATPESCGIFSTTTELFPYSYPDSGPPAPPFNNFLIDEACPNGSFNPPFTAGSQNLQAGGYTNFVASFERSDTEQELAGLTVTLPPGLLANVAGVPECSESAIHAAEAGTGGGAGGCPDNTQVGTVQAGVGPGPDPFFAQGKAYWTGPYKGGPFGIAVIVPAVAGPFDFGTVVVRQSIHLDPHTAQVTDVSDPFPTIIDGIPLRMRRVDVEFNRSAFTFNPTSCARQESKGTISGFPLGAPTEVNQYKVGYATQPGATHAFSAPFQVTNCNTLKFTPKFSVSTSGKTSKSGGASLTAKLSYPGAPQGTYANIARVKVDLPKQLPSRLTTLQRACTNAQFVADPAGCPKESMIGFATVHTPILPQPLSGPAIFVSHGGEAFPSLTMVLQGDGVTVDLVGTTFISKAGITSTTFKTVPDTPFSTFELTLPQGRFSALTANGDLCTSRLTMPTEFTAQNGAQIDQNTPVSVTGCAKKKTLTRAQLATALKACHKRHNHAKRAACERAAHRHYGPAKRKKR